MTDADATGEPLTSAPLSTVLTSPAVPAAAAPVAARRPSLARLLAAWGIACVVLAWAATAVFMRHERADALAARAVSNMNLARSLEETSLRVLSAVDQATRRLAQAVATGGYDPARIGPIASETGLVPNILVQLSYVDAEGRFAGSNLDPDGSRTGHVDLREREHVRAHLAPDSVAADARGLMADGLFIGKPVLGKVSGRWTIQLSRRVTGADGRTLGVVVASLDPGYFESVYRTVDLGAGGSVALIGGDRVVRARVASARGAGMGLKAGDNNPLAQAGAADSGTFTTVSAIDGVERVTAYHRVAGYPLYVFVGTAQDVALADWRAMAGLVVALMTLLSAVIALGLAVFARGVRRLEASEARAQAANHAKNEFLAAISHELRTPLTSIRGFAELMERRLEEPRFRESAGMIRRSAEHLNTLLTEILDFAKMEAGAMVVHPAPVALAPLLQGVQEFFRVTAAEKGLALELRLAPGLPEQVLVDELRVKQVLNNLMSNALKFTASGSVTLSAATEGGRLHIDVVDTGPGIPPELQELVFERFRQANAKIANDHGGTCLGLALARGLAERMGGTLTLHSAVGVGSTFRLALPLQALG